MDFKNDGVKKYEKYHLGQRVIPTNAKGSYSGTALYDCFV
jgi:hypothetical protein